MGFGTVPRKQHKTISSYEQHMLGKLPLPWIAAAIFSVLTLIDIAITYVLANFFLLSTGSTLLSLFSGGYLGALGYAFGIVVMLIVFATVFLDRVLFPKFPTWVGRMTLILGVIVALAFYLLVWPILSAMLGYHF
jgi:hypothetical protein